VKLRRGRTLSPESEACEQALLALLANGAAWPTGALEDATGYGTRGMLVYRTLRRMLGRGLVEQVDVETGGRVAFWRWLPNEGNCDQTEGAAPVPCAGWCYAGGTGCQRCRIWAYDELRGPGCKPDPRWLR
jgi:hypothetical protein